MAEWSPDDHHYFRMQLAQMFKEYTKFHPDTPGLLFLSALPRMGTGPA